MAVFLVERGQIAAKIETTKGTANAPAAIDAGIEVYDVSYTPEIGIAERDDIRSTFDKRKNITGSRAARVTFRAAIKGGSSAGSRPEVWALLRACCTTEAIVASTSVTYTPTTAESAQETLTIDVYRDGLVYRILGAMGNVRAIVKENEVPMFEFEFRGVYVAPTDTALLTGVTYVSTGPPQPVSMTLTLHSQTLRATGFEFDMGNQIELRSDVTNAAGYVHAVCVNQDPTITVDPELETVATFDYITRLQNSTAGAFLGQVGTAAGNIFRLLCPNATITEAPHGDRNRLIIVNLTLKARGLADSGNDSFNLRWT